VVVAYTDADGQADADGRAGDPVEVKAGTGSGDGVAR
jgi:hypothetical protein